MGDPTIGIIGTGDFAAYFISALRNGGHHGRILLSPYSLKRAQSLAADQNCIVSESDGALIAQSDWVVLAVRPEQFEEVLPRLQLRAEQTLISAVAGVRIDQLREAAGGLVRVVRIMPSSYISVVGQGLFPLYPGFTDVEAVLGRAGNVLVFESEEGIELAMIGACLAGFMYRFTAQLERWFIEHGLERSKARHIVAGNFLGAAGNALTQTNVSLEEISNRIATPGTYTKIGLDHLLNVNAFHPWIEALDLIDDRMKSCSNSQAVDGRDDGYPPI
ncbi:NAD(P)-binding domain-containing protein [Rhizobium lusitanum]|uniref:NAD(P)-binding domain-containing protein n=1 Tax=Rhizobium lusitanum TaxID=293958 RepID=UPI0019587A2D|nr:NAD(P)-binding domain-containing protein [Rhizobium lusitanum]MBM7045524.1 NAD(P)-binding domain-containing protein [Rhizobium lusitanum]